MAHYLFNSGNMVKTRERATHTAKVANALYGCNAEVKYVDLRYGGPGYAVVAKHIAQDDLTRIAGKV